MEFTGKRYAYHILSGTYWQTQVTTENLMTEENRVTQAKRRRGRPPAPSSVARSNRLVTFVTDNELEYLMNIVDDEDRSMASVIHRVIAAHISSKQKNV